jgi:hypothetical protein
MKQYWHIQLIPKFPERRFEIVGGGVTEYGLVTLDPKLRHNACMDSLFNIYLGNSNVRTETAGALFGSQWRCWF